MLPGNRGVERNWSPLWSLWRAEDNPKTGATSQSLLWNFYRHDTAPGIEKMLAPFRPFPVSIRFRREMHAPVLYSGGQNQTRNDK